MSTAHATVAEATCDWFALGFSHHLSPGHVSEAHLLGHELALWRPLDGGPAKAWENRCPHRSLRLSLGFVQGDQLVCRYHGWRYGRDGRCAGVPSSPDTQAPPAACVRTYLCHEADGVLWASLALTPRGYPPRLPDLVACRSFTFDASGEAIAAALAVAGSPLPAGHGWQGTDAQGMPWTLLVAPMDTATCQLHVLTHAEAAPAERRRTAHELMRQLPMWLAARQVPAQESAHA